MKTLFLFLALAFPLVPAHAGKSPINGKTQDNAETKLSNALATAKAQGKKVFLRFSDTWCGHCIRMQKILDRPNMKASFGADLVDLKVELSLVPGGPKLYAKYAKPHDGIPWFAILENDGKVSFTSVATNGNVGCPETAAEIQFFIDGLRKNTKLTQSQLDEIAAEFKKP